MEDGPAFYGLHRKIALKKELLYFLANRDDFISSREIAKELNLGNPQQAQLLYHELKEDIAKYYKQNEFEIVINQIQGVRMIKNHGDIHLLINEYHYTELSFHLMVHLYYNRVIETSDFCAELFVSEATLRRRIRQLNKNLRPFTLRITCARKITLVGTEKDIRAYYTLSSYSIFRKLSNLPSEYTEKDIHLEDAQVISKILRVMGGGFSKAESDMIALFFVTHSYPINQGYSLSEEFENHAPFNLKMFPQKPKFLQNWLDGDWYFFLFSAYLFDLYRVGPLEKHLIQSDIYKNRGLDWERLFKKNFPIHPVQNLLETKKQLARFFLFKSVYPVDNYIFRLFPILSFTKQMTRYPMHLRRFEQFWKEYTQLHPIMRTYHFKTNCLLLTLYLTPLSERKEEISIYVESKFSPQYTDYLMTSLTDYFYARYSLRFVSRKEKADLVLSTVKNLLPDNQDGSTYIHPLVPENDFELIEQRINQIIKERSQI